MKPSTLYALLNTLTDPTLDTDLKEKAHDTVYDEIARLYDRVDKAEARAIPTADVEPLNLGVLGIDKPFDNAIQIGLMGRTFLVRHPALQDAISSIKNHTLIYAVKAIRQDTQCGIKEAKEIAEWIAGRLWLSRML